jgi:hypothetical protein
MRYVVCLDVGGECSGYGEAMLQVRVFSRKKHDPAGSKLDEGNKGG